MPIKEIKKSVGGLNTDDNPSILPEGDFVDALNVRVGSSNEQRGVGLVETLQGELEVILDVSAPFTTYYGDAIGGEFLYIGFEEVKIGNQVWMKKNWDDDYPGNKVYDDDEENADEYGRLYTHNQAMAEDFCPEGYHIPTEADIDELLEYLGGAIIAGAAMKELWTEHWLAPNTGADNSSGFKGLPGGMYDTAFDLLQEMGLFWLADEAEPLAPVATEATEISYDSFRANWLTAEGATGYRLDVATDEDFTSFVAGYEDLDVGNVLTYEISGLDETSSYYYRVRAYNEIGESEDSNIVNIITLGVYMDWFLPSKDELNQMYLNLYLFGVGGFSTSEQPYWSSSEGASTAGWGQTFHRSIPPPEEGTQSWASKNSPLGVRAIRTFTASIGAYSLRDIGPAKGRIFYIDGAGTTYLEAAPSDQSTGKAWSNISTVLIGTTSTAIGEGQNNTNEIIAQAGHTDSAAKLCDDLVITV